MAAKIIIPVDILGIGDAMVDLTTRASQLPPKGGNIWSTAVRLSPGGTTANVAANIAKLGISSGFAGCVGDDPYGHYIISDFQNAGVNTLGITARQETYTGIVLAIIDDEGERTFIACAKGASHTLLLDEDLERLDYTSIPVIHTSGVCLVEEPARSTLLKALGQAHDVGCLVYYDPNLRLEGDYFPGALREAQMEAISLADTVLIGEEELSLLFDAKTCGQGVDALRKLGPGTVVVKEGKRGATVHSDAGEVSHPAFTVPVVSTAGAGDAFDAGFIAARLQKASLQDALEFACAVAAIKVTRSGSRSVPDYHEAVNFLKSKHEDIT